MDAHRQPALGDPRPDVDRHLEDVRADLREPEAVLLDQVDARAGMRPGGRGPLSRSSTSTSSPGRTVAAKAVRSPSQTIGFPSASSQCDAICTPSRPRDRHGAEPAFSSRTRATAASPALIAGTSWPSQRTASGPDGNGMLADALHGATTLSAWLSHSWCALRAASRPSARRSGSCGRRGARCPSTARSGSDYTLFEVCEQPELCAEVTLQPVRRHDVDAAVMFADIMLPVLTMGIEVELVENVGPVVSEPVRSRAAVERLGAGEPPDATLEAVRIVRRELRPDQALVGFCGGPFTVAGYLVEGRPSREFTTLKTLMYSEPDTWHALMERLADCFARYVAAKVEAGADVIQLFDSWVGALSPADYDEFVAPWSARILEAVDVPTIHFGTGTATLLNSMAAAGGDVIGLDWRIPLDRGWNEVGHDRGVQGNLDPAVLLGPWERVEREAQRVLALAGGRPGHIFNLGHGVLPDTQPEMLTRLVSYVREASTEAAAA